MIMFFIAIALSIADDNLKKKTSSKLRNMIDEELFIQLFYNNIFNKYGEMIVIFS